MTYKPQKFKDIQEVDPLADSVQLKYDGWWTQIVFHNGSYETYSKTNRLIDQGGIFPSCPNCVFIAEYLYGTQWSQTPERKGTYLIFDLVEYEGADLSDLPYNERITAAKRIRPSLPSSKFSVVGTYPLEMTSHLWTNEVLTDNYEGLVFRRSSDPYSVKLSRWKPRYYKTLRATDFVEGAGKHAGRLGAIIATGTDGNEDNSQRVGGGFSDTEREEIWADQEKFRGQWFEAVGRRVFDSGSLRHPNFVDWK